MMSISRLYFSMMLFVPLFMLPSFWAVVSKQGKQDTTIVPLTVVGTSTATSTVYIADGGEKASSITSSSNSKSSINHINQASPHAPFFTQNPETTTGSSNDGFVDAIDKSAYTSGMIRDDAASKVKLANLIDPTSQPTQLPSSPSSSQPVYYVIPNLDCSGYDIGSFTPNSRQSCNSLCDSYSSSGCVGTVWSEGPTCSRDSRCGKCWLKTSLQSCTVDTGSTTSVQMKNSDSNYHVISNFDCGHNDLGSDPYYIDSSTVSSCKAACITNTLCVGFVIEPSTGYCWLKAGIYNNLNCGSGDGKHLYVKKKYETIQGNENVMITTNFEFSGNYQTYNVPPVIESLFVTAAGASAVDPLGSTGIVNGGVIQAMIPVSSITTLYLYLGGQNTGGGSNAIGGFNGGGTNQGGVAGGAGGSSGYGAGGAGGGLIGATGSSAYGDGGGGGGTQSSGGMDLANHNTDANTAGSLCQGGNGWYASGGGGYYGGAGDGSNGGDDTQAGGGGGSSYCIPTGTIVANNQGTHNGDGFLMIQQCVTEYEFVNKTCTKIIYPTGQPTMVPTNLPSEIPSEHPSAQPSIQVLDTCYHVMSL